MNLLYITAGLPFARGETFIIPEILGLQSRGHTVTVAPVRPYRPVLHEDARALLPFAVSQPMLSLSVVRGAVSECLRHPFRSLGAIGALLRSRSRTVLLKNLAVVPKGLWLARVARQVGADQIHAHWASTSATAAMIAARVADVPWSFTAHRWDIAENNLIHEKARSASFVRAIDQGGGEELRARMGAFASKLVVIHMGVDLSPVRARPASRPAGTLRVVMAAFFQEKKGHTYALEAMRLLRERGSQVTLDLAGEGPLLRDVEARAHALAVTDNVRFLGMVGHSELLDGLAHGRWDAALLPSIVTEEGDKEGIPVFLMEAMAAGVPVIATGTGGIPELLTGAGLIIPQRDPAAIAEALERLCRDPSLREQLGVAGMRSVHAEFSAASSVERLLERFEEVAASSREAEGGQHPSVTGCRTP